MSNLCPWFEPTRYVSLYVKDCIGPTAVALISRYHNCSKASAFLYSYTMLDEVWLDDNMHEAYVISTFNIYLYKVHVRKSMKYMQIEYLYA